jgi:hypothetical protein
MVCRFAVRPRSDFVIPIADAACGGRVSREWHPAPAVFTGLLNLGVRSASKTDGAVLWGSIPHGPARWNENASMGFNGQARWRAKSEVRVRFPVDALAKIGV